MLSVPHVPPTSPYLSLSRILFPHIVVGSGGVAVDDSFSLWKMCNIWFITSPGRCRRASATKRLAAVSADGQGAGPNVSNKMLSCKGSTEQGPTSATKDSAAEAAAGYGAEPNFSIMLPGQQATASSQPTLRRRPASCSQQGIAPITDLTPTQRRVSDSLF